MVPSILIAHAGTAAGLTLKQVDRLTPLNGTVHRKLAATFLPRPIGEARDRMPAARLAAQSAEGLALTKEALNASARNAPSAQLDPTPDYTGYVPAFMETRTPVFSGLAGGTLECFRKSVKRFSDKKHGKTKT